MSATDVFVYRSSGAAQFDVGHVQVQVWPQVDAGPDEPREVAEKLHDAALAIEAAELREAAWKRECEARDARIRVLELGLASERARNPKAPARLLGPGTVRFDVDGKLWILNKRESGFGSFGFVVGDWDELFRRFNVRVTAHGEDGHGAWWEVSPCGA